jgi:hypothetical protein
MLTQRVPLQLQDRARQLVGRQWVLEQVLDWLTDGSERYFLMTGEPGSGKSTIAAWLAMPQLEWRTENPLELVRASWSARHFCMVRDGGTIDPRRFTQTIADQLASRHDEFALSVAARAGPQYNVRLEIRENWGSAVGVQIQNLFVTGATVQDAFSAAVSQPLFALRERRPDLRIPILVDGLDEALISTEPNILDLVSGEVDVPDSVRLFLTSRNERRVTDRFLDRAMGCRHLNLSGPGTALENDSDLRVYIMGRVRREPLAAQQANDGPFEPTIDEIVRRAAGNFLYARMLLDEVATGHRQITDLAGLPAGLHALYRAYLHRLMPDIDQYGHSSLWLNEYRPLLGCLCAAVAPASAGVLAGWLGRDPGELIARLDDLQQVVRFDPDSDGYRLYHTSMTDFLAAIRTEDGRPNFFFTSPAEQHERIVQFYLNSAYGDWSKCDPYGLAFLPRHIALWADAAADAATRSARADILYKLVTTPAFTSAQMTHFGSTQVTADSFRIALETARAMERLDQSGLILDVLGRSPYVELRGVCVEELVTLHPRAADHVARKIRDLLSAESEDAWRVGLKAAYLIGPEAKAIFRWIALKGSIQLRRSAEYALYLRWTAEPDNFTNELLDDLSHHVRVARPLSSSRILHFLANVSITIYINHCDDVAVGKRTSDLWHQMIVRGPHLRAIRQPSLDRIIGMGVSRLFGRRILEGAVSSDFQDPMRFFAASGSDKTVFRRAIPYVDPTTEIRDALEDLAQLLRSDIMMFRNLAQVVIAVHAYAHPRDVEPLVRQLADRLDPIGRLWLLLAFSVLLPDAPQSWVKLLEDLTSDFFQNDPSNIVYGAALPSGFDPPLLPLGLAYGKAGGSMPLFVAWLRDALTRGDYHVVGNLITWLSPVALYYPHTVLGTLTEAGVSLIDERLGDEIINALAVVRTLHFDEVDAFLERAGAGRLAPLVTARSDIELVRRYIGLIGYYNNVVHQAVYYPRMRYGLLIPCLNELVGANAPSEFIRRFTPISLAMLRDADYRLENWTLPL